MKENESVKARKNTSQKSDKREKGCSMKENKKKKPGKIHPKRAKIEKRVVKVNNYGVYKGQIKYMEI